MIISKDADLQADRDATLLIEALRDSTRAKTDYARLLIVRLSRPAGQRK
jgi:hypothetical protein